MKYTKRQKKALIDHLITERDIVAKRNEEILQKRSQETYRKILRRLQAVSVTLLDVKLKDVLQVERRKKLVARELIADIHALQKSEVAKYRA